MSISLTDPAVIIAGIKQFGLAPDGSDLRDLVAAFGRLRAELDEADALIANLLGVGELAGAYPEGTSKETAMHSWQRRGLDRHHVNEQSPQEERKDG